VAGVSAQESAKDVKNRGESKARPSLGRTIEGSLGGVGGSPETDRNTRNNRKSGHGACPVSKTSPAGVKTKIEE